jgi:hypothetical protein
MHMLDNRRNVIMRKFRVLLGKATLYRIAALRALAVRAVRSTVRAHDSCAAILCERLAISAVLHSVNGPMQFRKRRDRKLGHTG